MHKIIVVDLEATCWAESDPEHKEHAVSEILEIGAAKVDLVKGEIIDTFTALVKPKNNPVLSDFCKELTGIQQEDLKGQARWPEVYAHFLKFCGSRHKQIMGGWGAYDGRMIAQECERHGLESKHPYEYWNVKNIFAARHGARMGLARAMDLVKLDPHGQAHRALPDAINAARLLIQLFHPNAPA